SYASRPLRALHSFPTRRSSDLDLHVLSTPPAFILSQDQTLQTKTKCSDQLRSKQTRRKHPAPGNTAHHPTEVGQPQQPFKKMASNKLGTLLSSQTTTPTNQHTHTRHASQQETKP